MVLLERKETSMTTYTDRDFAKVALWLDDPYGDGIRLEAIRNPSPARAAALDLVKTGQHTLLGDEQRYIEAGRQYLATKQGRSMVVRQRVL